MRGVRLFVCASILAWTACSAPPADPPPPAFADPPKAAASIPVAPLEIPRDPVALQLVTDPTPGGGAIKPAPEAAPSGVVRTAVEVPVRREPTFEDVLKLQKEISARNPASDEDRLRVALLQAAVGDFEEAERVLSTVRSRSNRLQPYVELFLRRQLGDHQEAAKILTRLDEEERRVAGFVVERAELVSRVRRFRDYTPAANDRVPPGGEVHLYVEPRNFSAQRSGDQHAIHLRYEWRLYDERDREQPVPAWTNAKAEDREDRVSTRGAVTEFYQSFRLPLPANLAAGRYRVSITVLDVVSGKSDRAFVPITVLPMEKSR